MTIRNLGIIVRPQVIPNLRPDPPPPKIETDNPNDIEIIGRGGGLVNLDHSRSYHMSRSVKRRESYRIFDVVRIYNATNRSMYIDCEITHYIQYVNELGQLVVDKFAKPKGSATQEILQVNQKRSLTRAEMGI